MKSWVDWVKWVGLVFLGLVLAIFFIGLRANSIRKANAPMMGVIQAVSSDGKVTNTYYGDFSDGWNKKINLNLDPKEWKLQVEKRGQYQELLQYLHPNDSISKWTEMIAVERLVGPMVSRITAREIANKMKNKAEIVSVSDNEVIYQGTSKDISRFDWVRVLCDKDVIVTLTYAAQGKIDEEKIDLRKKILNEATIS